MAEGGQNNVGLADYILSTPSGDPVRARLLSAGRRVLEAVYPHQATARLRLDHMKAESRATMEALLSGNAYREPAWRDLVAGSRAEGLGIERGWGQEPADLDTMSLYGDSWGVRIPDAERGADPSDGADATRPGSTSAHYLDADPSDGAGATEPGNTGAHYLDAGTLNGADATEPGSTGAFPGHLDTDPLDGAHATRPGSTGENYLDADPLDAADETEPGSTSASHLDADPLDAAHATEPGNTSASYPEMVPAESPCFCHVRVIGNSQNLVDTIAQGIARGTTTPEEIIANAIMVGTFAGLLAVTPGMTLGAFLMDLTGWSLFGRFFTPAQRGELYNKHTTAQSYRTMDSWRRKLPDVISSQWSIGELKARECFCVKNGVQYLSSAKVLRLLSDPRHSQNYQGPSQVVGEKDLVPALVCSGPFPCIPDYLSRSRYGGWPSAEARTDIQAMPGVIVPIGNMDSLTSEAEWGYSFSPQELRMAQEMPEWVIVPDAATDSLTFEAELRYSFSPQELRMEQEMPEWVIVPEAASDSPTFETEWRESYSAQELRLSQDMPEWVKAAYRALKYTFKAVHKRNMTTINPSESNSDSWMSSLRAAGQYVMDGAVYCANIAYGSVPDTRAPNVAGRKHVSSYHLKTTLLWTLEDELTWQEQCPFRLMLILLRKLETYLASGRLPHYFNEDYNLLRNISDEERTLARSCVEDILSDPVNSIINAPSDTKKIQKLGVDLNALKEEFENAIAESGLQ